MSLIVDISNLNGVLTDEDVVAIRRAGVDGALVGLQYPTRLDLYQPGVAHQQIPALINGGVPVVGCYAMSQFVGDVWHNVAQFKSDIPQVFVDCEDDSVDRAYIDRSLDVIDGLGLACRGGIYTGAWWWNGKEFAHWFGDRDLWIANYDNNFSLSLPQVGDWTQAKYKQVIGDTNIGRLRVDLNISMKW